MFDYDSADTVERNPIFVAIYNGRTNSIVNKVESWVKQGRIMSRTGSIESNMVKSCVVQGQIMMRTGPNHESNTVEQGRIMSRTGSIESNRVES